MDWYTASCFRIRVAPAAVEKLMQLPPELQLRVRQMMEDIADLADATPLDAGGTWRSGDGRQLLHLRLGRIDVRYSIGDESRTLTIEHMVVPQGGDIDQAG